MTTSDELFGVCFTLRGNSTLPSHVYLSPEEYPSYTLNLFTYLYFRAEEYPPAKPICGFLLRDRWILIKEAGRWK